MTGLRVLGAVCLAAVLLGGCVDFSYVGQEFAPTPASQPVLFFRNRSQLPVGKYQIIGRATIQAPDGTDVFDLEELLLQRAREYGADAVCMVETKRIELGAYEIENAAFDGPSEPLDPGNLNWDGSAVAVNTFGEQVNVGGEKMRREEVVVKALFLKDRKVLRRLLAERGRELEELLQQPIVEPARPEKTPTDEDTIQLPENDGGDEQDVTDEEVPAPDIEKKADIQD